MVNKNYASCSVMYDLRIKNRVMNCCMNTESKTGKGAQS